MTNTTEIPYGYCHCGCGKKTKICKENNTKYGWVSGEPFKFVLNHRGKGLDAEPVTERFWKKVDKHGPDDCWEWKEARSDSGYGKFWWSGRTIHASRAAYMLTHGELPSRIIVRHRCDNPPCCNPAHLVEGTNSDNSADMVSRQRQSFGRKHSEKITKNLPRGSKHHNSRFTEEQVAAMRALHSTGEWSQRVLARVFNTTQPVIQNIVTYKSRKQG